MEFMDKMKETLNEEFNEEVTENGALGYRTTGKTMLDFNYKVASYRDKSENEIIKDFDKVWLDDKILAMQFLFFIRDREEGLGERRLFRVIIKHLANTEPEMVKKVVPIIADYGRYDDLLELLDTPVDEEVYHIIFEQLNIDNQDYRNNKPISLLAKWLPSINASSKIQKERAKKIIKHYKINEKDYRKMLSELRKYIDVTERKMCSNEWDKIKYENVPSRANLIYNNAFLRHDEERRKEFLRKVEKGERKINSGKLYPYDIVHKYMKTQGWDINITANDETLEQLWKALPKKEIANTLVVADGSGSMTSKIGNTNVTALDIANSLAIYFAEHNKGQFKNKYITFSEIPQFVDFEGCTSLHDKISKALAYDEIANTNIKAVFDLILESAKKYRLAQDEMPANILIISDMEFDYATDEDINEKLFKIIERQYNEVGYKLPRLVFWNVKSRTGAIPLKENKLGVALVSGFSANIAEMVMSSELDPLRVLIEKLKSERYKKVAEVLEG